MVETQKAMFARAKNYKGNMMTLKNGNFRDKHNDRLKSKRKTIDDYMKDAKMKEGFKMIDS